MKHISGVHLRTKAFSTLCGTMNLNTLAVNFHTPTVLGIFIKYRSADVLPALTAKKQMSQQTALLIILLHPFCFGLTIYTPAMNYELLTHQKLMMISAYFTV